MQNFETRLTGGHPNSLGNIEDVVKEVLAENGYFDELFNCYFSDDEVVRLRTSSAMKRICKAQKELLLPYLDRFLTEIAAINQASTQWTLAQLFDLLKKDMSSQQVEQARAIMKNNLAHHNDWIVLNTTMEVLTKWSDSDTELKEWIKPHLMRLVGDKRKSVANRARKFLAAYF